MWSCSESNFPCIISIWKSIHLWQQCKENINFSSLGIVFLSGLCDIAYDSVERVKLLDSSLSGTGLSERLKNRLQDIWYGHLEIPCIKNKICFGNNMLGFPGVKNLPAHIGDAGDMGSISELGRSPGVGNGNLLQYSCLENSMDRGAWQATAHGVTKSQTQLTLCKYTHTHTHHSRGSHLYKVPNSLCEVGCFL